MKQRFSLQGLFKNFNRFFSEIVWEKDIQTIPVLTRVPVYLARLIYLVYRGFVKNNNFVRATALAYTTLLSIVPLLAVMFALFKAFGGFERFGERLHPFLYRFFNITEGSEVYKQIWEFVDRVHAGALGFAGSLILVIAAVSLFVVMERSFNEIWGVQAGRTWAKRLTNYWSLMTLGPLLLAASVWLPAPWILLTIFIIFLYLFVPYTKVWLRSAVIGGIVAGFLLEAARALFSLYTANYISYEKIYGAMAAIPLFLIWIEICWVIILIGAEIAFADQNMRRYREEQLAVGASLGQRETIAIQIMLKITEQFVNHQESLTAASLGESLQLPLRLVREILFHLNKANLVVYIGEVPHQYYPARSPNLLTLFDVIQAYRDAGEKKIHVRDTKLTRSVEEQLAKVREKMKHELGMTLEQFIKT